MPDITQSRNFLGEYHNFLTSWDICRKVFQSGQVTATGDIPAQEELENLRTRLNTRTLGLETLQKSYERLDKEHSALRRLMDVKEAEKRTLEDLLEIEREVSKKSKEDPAFAVQENRIIKQRMLEYESRMVVLHNEVSLTLSLLGKRE